jgi:serine/threonine-protein kinase
MIQVAMVNLPSEGDVLAGKYRVERMVGRGGMGVVIAAWHLELDQRVALKFLQPELAERNEAAERFRREARSAAKIKSEHVARVLDVGTLDGNIPYMVMEYLEGQDLSEESRTRGVLPVQECVDYVIQAIEAVAEAHAIGIVHRDLKPENLFLSRRADGSRSVKVLDFGISKTLVLGSADGRSLTETSTMMGSPLYMSPEQMRAPRDVDARSDIWSIGAILYDLLTGRPPYLADSVMELCTLVLEAEPTPLRDMRADIPSGLEQVVARCLAKDRGKRWASVAEVARALLPYASPSSRIHAERAMRVLTPSGVNMPQAMGTLPSAESAAEKAAQRAETVDSGAVIVRRGTTPVQGTPGHRETQESWGKTNDPQGVEEPKKPRRWLAALAGGVLIVAGIGVAARFVAKPVAPVPPPAPDPATLVPSGLPSTPAEIPAAPSSEIPAPSRAAEVAPIPSALPAESAKPTAGQSAPKKGSPRPMPKPITSGGLTDFGGRR